MARSSPLLRCAIYTRTSSEERLVQDYNSLAAQKDACDAYILSQKQEGWVRSKKVYSDGGYSGGNLERPALQALLSDIAAKEVDIVVLYKIDRLTRSLRDFARLSEIFDRHGVSFVAVTQQFSTASSMGRLTLNILLTFAQFEREVAGDRIREKVAASARQGIWKGGGVALGYDASAGKLTVNPHEAQIVRQIFQRFLELRSMSELRKDLRKSGFTSKQSTSRAGLVHGGRNFTWTPLNHILTNPLYRGMIRNHDQLHPGRHEAIIEPALFDEVQRVVKEVAAGERAKRALAHPALFRSIIFDASGERMYPTHTKRKTKKFRYYAARYAVTSKNRGHAKNLLRVSAPALEKYVVQELASRFRDKTWITSNLPPLRSLKAIHGHAHNLAIEVSGQLSTNSGIIRKLVRRIELGKETIVIELNRAWVLERLEVRFPKNAAPVSHSPIRIEIAGHGLRCGQDMKIKKEGPDRSPQPDHRMVQEVLRGIRWFNYIATGKFKSAGEIASFEGCSQALVSERMRLAFLAPDIVEAIIKGHQPASLTNAKLRRLCPLPDSWEQQRRLLMQDDAPVKVHL